MIDTERVIQRLVNAEVVLQPWKQKVYRLRRVAAGDRDALITSIPGGTATQTRGREFTRQFRQANPDILIEEFSEGHNNEILKAVMILVEQTCYSFPKIEIHGLGPKRQAANNHWLAKMLEECHAVEHGKIALTDYLLGGTGDLYQPIENGQPVVRWADSLDIKFDPVARLPVNIRWKSVTVCEPLHAFVDLFKRSDAAMQAIKLVYGELEDSVLDMPAEFEFYYDTEGRGNYVVLAKTSDTTYHPEAIYSGANPHYEDYDGAKKPYLPFDSMFYMMLPSVKLPVSAMEKALPDQIGAWGQMGTIKETAERGGAFYEIGKGAFAGEEAKDAWLLAKKAGIAEVSEVGQIKEHAPLAVGPVVVEMLTMHTQNIQTQLGANNYSLGAPVSGVKYAREVNAMQAAGSLTAGAISKTNAACWERFCHKMLCAGKRINSGRNFSFWIEGVLMEYGKDKPAGPIGFYLAPEATLTIAEDSMRFMPQAQRMELSGMLLDRALMLNQEFPKGVELAARRFYTDAGVENVDAWVEAGPPAMGMGVNSQVPGGMPNGAGVAQVQPAAPPPAMPEGNQ